MLHWGANKSVHTCVCATPTIPGFFNRRTLQVTECMLLNKYTQARLIRPSLISRFCTITNPWDTDMLHWQPMFNPLLIHHYNFIESL